MTLLNIENLQVSFATYRGKIKALRGIDLKIEPGEIWGIVGESGCGKSVTAHALMGLLPKEIATVEAGSSITFLGKDLLQYKTKDWQNLRGQDIAMIFQDPMTSLNPVLSIGKQLKEAIASHNIMTEAQLKARAVELLDMVGIPSPEKRLSAYPHQFSGGMRQRVVIAIALASNPKLLIADEPTTALDVTVQAKILELLKDLNRQLGMAIILISHDLGVVANLTDKVAIMYAGEIVETGSIEDIFYNPHHPYTKGLLQSIPKVNSSPDEPLYMIKGQPMDLKIQGNFCSFLERCPDAMKICSKNKPAEVNLTGEHSIRCWLEAKNEVMP